MTNEEIARFFNDTQAYIQGNPDLRDPQVEGWFRTRQHFRNSSEHAILQIPVGCGKTGLMALLPFGIAQGRVLVIAPNLEIRRGISTAFDIAGRDCFWTYTRVLTDVNHGPYTAVLDGQDANIHDCENSHIVVTNIQQLASRADRWLPAFPDDFFDLIMVDEGHHNVARSWEGAIAVAQPEDEGRVGSHRFITCVPKEGIVTAEFLRFYFLTEEGLRKIGEASPGGAGRNRTLGLKKLAEIEVPVPDYREQLWFDRLQAKVREMLARQQDAETELDAMLPSALDKAFKGELSSSLSADEVRPK